MTKGIISSQDWEEIHVQVKDENDTVIVTKKEALDHIFDDHFHCLNEMEATSQATRHFLHIEEQREITITWEKVMIKLNEIQLCITKGLEALRKEQAEQFSSLLKRLQSSTPASHMRQPENIERGTIEGNVAYLESVDIDETQSEKQVLRDADDGSREMFQTRHDDNEREYEKRETEEKRDKLAEER